jgi:predicted ribosome quality control (RQC) complex YloA/Tae2 family protein
LYLDTVFDSLTRAETENDLNEIRRELYESGYASRMKGYTQGKPTSPKPIEYRTSGGWRVLCGKNNSQNDHITHKIAGKGDLWFHIKDYPGSHVVLICDGDEPDSLDYTEAANIAAVNSKAPAGQRVTVDYTRIKNIKKPPNAKPGFVTFANNYSAYVIPDPAGAEALRVKK